MMGMKIAEVPTTLSPDERSRPPHLRPYRDGWRHLRFMLLFSPNWLFLYPGLALMFVSLIAASWLLLTPIHVSHVRLGIDTLIYCAFMVMAGYQSVLFAVLSKVYAVQEHLYPPSRAYNYFFRHIRLERGIVVGLLLFLVGIGSTLYAILVWRRHGFGMLDFEHIARISIPSGLTMALGMETLLFSFFLSTLGMNVRQHSTESPSEYVAEESIVAIS
jgi:hypothetical protein